MATDDKIPADGSPAPADAGGAAAVDAGGGGDQGAAPVDDGFSPEERQQFEEMQRADTAPVDGAPAPAEPPPADGAAPAPDAGAAPPAEAGDDDADDDDEPAGDAAPADGKLGADGKPFRRKPPRVSRKKYETAEAERARLAEELRVTSEREARGDERLKILAEALKTPKGAQQEQPKDDDPEPDPEADVFGWIQWSKRDRERLKSQIDGVQQSRQAEQSDNSLSTAYMDDARSFAAKEPNFVPAYQHLMQSRTIEMALYWFGKDVTDPNCPALTPQEIQRIKAGVAEEEKQLAAAAMNAGQSPAARMFALAKARGYRPAAAAAAAAASAAAAAPTNGAAGKPTASAKPPATSGAAPANGAAPSVKDEIDRIVSGQDAALSLSAGGGAPSSPLTARKLADMPQDKFNELVENMTPEEFQRLVEGTP